MRTCWLGYIPATRSHLLRGHCGWRNGSGLLEGEIPGLSARLPYHVAVRAGLCPRPVVRRVVPAAMMGRLAHLADRYEYRQPLVQAGNPQEFSDQRGRRESGRSGIRPRRPRWRGEQMYAARTHRKRSGLPGRAQAAQVCGRSPRGPARTGCRPWRDPALPAPDDQGRVTATGGLHLRALAHCTTFGWAADAVRPEPRTAAGRTQGDRPRDLHERSAYGRPRS